jgi:hypothetical protein
MQHIITSDDIFDAIGTHSAATMMVVRSWYDLLAAEKIESGLKRELMQEIKGAIKSGSKPHATLVIIDLQT